MGKSLSDVIVNLPLTVILKYMVTVYWKLEKEHTSIGIV